MYADGKNNLQICALVLQGYAAILQWFIAWLMTGVTHETPGKVNVSGLTAGATLDWSMRSDSVARGDFEAARTIFFLA